MPTLPPSLIVFEGINGGGKSSAIAAIHAHLNHIGVDCIVTSEMGHTMLGSRLTHLIEESGEYLSPKAHLHLYTAARAEHAEKVIKPAISHGQVILMDRYTASTVAYQGYGQGISLQDIARINAIASGGWVANLTLWFDLEVDEAIERLHSREDYGDPEFLERVKNGYQALYADSPDRWVRIKAGQSPEKVVKDCLTAIWDYAKSSKADVSGWGRKEIDPGWKG